MIKPTKFIIACFDQNALDVDTNANTLLPWAARGVNTSLGGPNPYPNCSRQQFYQNAYAAGLQTMLQIPVPAVNESTQPSFLGGMQVDEPGNWNNFGYTPAGVAAWVKTYCAQSTAWKTANPNTPVFGNFTDITYEGPTETTNQPIAIADQQAFESACDWVCIDQYLRNNGQPVTSFPTTMGIPLQTLNVRGSGQSIMAFIECSQQNAGGNPGPTDVEFIFECWASIVWGVQGLAYFSHQLTPNLVPDATLPDVDAAMKVLNPFLASLSPVLIQSASPLSVTGTVYSSTRVYQGATYTFAVNNSMAPTSFTVTVSGSTVSGSPIQMAALEAVVFQGAKLIYRSTVAPTTTPTPAVKTINSVTTTVTYSDGSSIVGPNILS